MSKVYAKQVNPEYQESPLMLYEEYPETIILTGNHNYPSHTIPAYDAIMERFDDMAETWEDIGGKSYFGGKRYTISEALREYGFEREDGKPWSNRDKHGWRFCMESCDYTICDLLELITRKKWETTTIHGTSQSEWQHVFYVEDEWDKSALDNFEAEYFI